MLFNNFVAAAFLAFASVGMTSPVPITGDISVGDTNPLIAARQRVVPKPSGPVPGAPNKGSAATAILGIAEKINLLIQQTIDKDLEFTQDVAARTAAAFPGRGVVVCNVGFKTTGTVVQQTTVRYDAKLGTTVTFEVVVLGAGASFTRQGDGGFENWAYSIPGSCRANRQTISC
ncbi:hypothetical protein VDGD_09319 [Verticillium dahliae]|uniref:Uncharacterized protein n=1 Tax=Verticillium dahliae TaxID=27337 RepID=A0A366NMZ6_VERDA|nr:hypothetical protein VD0001_g4249 [Verticillium dahliae]RBQ77036.1 hypothetical protein VDGD_09319 [Verticillium dahliae]RXG47202.1 hypothetical protein VDGE_09319 [Verticillium dahliae]